MNLPPKIKQILRAFRSFIVDAGVDLYLRTDDRRILEKIILPHYAALAGCQSILSIGCDWYTKGYQKFFAGRNYWTIDIDPQQRKYGSAQHIVDSAVNLRYHFQAGMFDLILCNGVFGWGLDTKDDAEKALIAFNECLRMQGSLVLGWNDISERSPFGIGQLDTSDRFCPIVFEPLGASRFLTKSANRHTYDFLEKK